MQITGVASSDILAENKYIIWEYFIDMVSINVFGIHNLHCVNIINCNLVAIDTTVCSLQKLFAVAVQLTANTKSFSDPLHIGAQQD